MKSTGKWLAGLAAVTMLMSVVAPAALAHHTDWYTKRGLIPPGQLYQASPYLYYRDAHPILSFFQPQPTVLSRYYWDRSRYYR